MKWHGQILFVETEKGADDRWTPTKTYRPYYGEVLRNIRRWDSSQTVNGDVNINNQISIVADPYILGHLAYIKAIQWNNKFWKVTSIEQNYPRLTLDLGGLYNEESA